MLFKSNINYYNDKTIDDSSIVSVKLFTNTFSNITELKLPDLKDYITLAIPRKY